jgi:hypothetical protein
VIRNWAIGFDMPHEIERIWNGTVVSYNNGTYIVKNPGYNADIMPGESRTIGFIAKLETETVTPPGAYYWIVAPKKEETEYRMTYKVNSDWGSAYNGQFELTNTKSSEIQDWVIEFDYENTINQFWTAEIVSHEGNHYVVRNMGYNGTIGAGQTITLGFEAKGDKTGSGEGPKNVKLITSYME